MVEALLALAALLCDAGQLPLPRFGDRLKCLFTYTHRLQLGFLS